MKYLFLIIFLAACSPYHKEKKEYSLPPELKDCKVFVVSDGFKNLYIMKCANEQPTVSWVVSCGKNCYTTVHSKILTK